MNIIEQTAGILEDFTEKIAPAHGCLVVIGISTSEIVGGHIGKQSSPQVGMDVIATLHKKLTAMNVAMAVQCCEHLNRALVMERSEAAKRGLTLVCVKPVPTAGGSGATAAYELFDDPVVVESVQADAGIDIGVTMIGMHLRPVVVPVRTSLTLGDARVDFAYSRPKLIGGHRAQYP